MRTICLTLLAAAALALPSASLSAREASGKLNIRLTVPEVCEVSTEQFALSGDGQIAGEVQEFCNSSTVFQIVASHRPLAVSESASIRYGNTERQLDASGLSPLVSRNGQRLARVGVRIRADDLEQPLAVAFSVVAI